MGLKYESTLGLSSKSSYTYVLERLDKILQQELYNFIHEQFSIQILFIEPLTCVYLVYASDRPHTSTWGCVSISVSLLDAVLLYVNGQMLGGLGYRNNMSHVAGGIDVFQSPWLSKEKTVARRRCSVSHLCNLVARTQPGKVKIWVEACQ